MPFPVKSSRQLVLKQAMENQMHTQQPQPQTSNPLFPLTPAAVRALLAQSEE